MLPTDIDPSELLESGEEDEASKAGGEDSDLEDTAASGNMAGSKGEILGVSDDASGADSDLEVTASDQSEGEDEADTERREVASTDRIIRSLEDMKEAGIVELRDESKAENKAADDTEGSEAVAAEEKEDLELVRGDEEQSLTEDKAESEAAVDKGAIFGADGYTCLLVTDEPLDVANLEGVEIDEAFVGGTKEDLQKPEVVDAMEAVDTQPATVEIVPVDLEGSGLDFPYAEQEALAAEAGIWQLRNARRPLYHPGGPDAKLQLMARITETMDYGRQEGWYVDLDTYDKVLKLLCEDPEQAVLAQDILHADLLVGCLLPCKAVPGIAVSQHAKPKALGCCFPKTMTHDQASFALSMFVGKTAHCL